VQLVGQSGGLADLCLQPAGNLTQGVKLLRHARCVLGAFDDGIAGLAIAVRHIRFPLGEVRSAVALVASRFAHGDGLGERQLAEEGLQISGVLAGGVDADVKMGGGKSSLELLQLLE